MTIKNKCTCKRRIRTYKIESQGTRITLSNRLQVNFLPRECLLSINMIQPLKHSSVKFETLRKHIYGTKLSIMRSKEGSYFQV
ncbi:Protein odr-4-like protein [Frankliniella fusca]|uniref:Protein odr-4-like protein n=1 Tax=Frankliniella fusca TaxID=407009 RepID=A0AAE1HLB3_9NEOP|nr:Protein odr-4-like protein [Frankliniella fusca]